MGISSFLLIGCDTTYTEKSSKTEEIISASDHSTEESPSSPDSFPASASSGVIEKKPFVIQNYSEDHCDLSGLTDPTPAQLLCQYFLDHLTPDDYIQIECWKDYVWKPSEINYSEIHYYVFLWAEDIELFSNLLDSYDGPWTPIVFEDASYSLSDLVKAESDVKVFLEDHPKITYTEVARTEGYVIVKDVKEGYAELSQFVDNYSIPELFSIGKYVPEELLNPD